MKTFVFGTAIAAMTLIGVAQDQQVIPKSINYQGRLADAEGDPIGGVEGGVFRLRFQLFPVAAEGEVLWAEERDVVVINGIFNVALGAAGGDSVGEVPNDLAGVFSTPERYLQVTVVSGPGITAEQALMPRQQLQSVPFTFMAQNAERAVVATLAESLIPELEKALNPPGTIIAYAGQVTDTGGLIELVPGYLLCNGAVIDSVAEEGKFQALRAALESAWGSAGDADSNTVNLPDLRGVFLRGWSGAASDSWVDEDRNSGTLRVARYVGGSTGNSVGSFQQDQFENHNHNNGSYQYLLRVTGTGTIKDVDNSAGELNLFTGSSIRSAGGSETRGKNAYVAYLIKY